MDATADGADVGYLDVEDALGALTDAARGDHEPSDPSAAAAAAAVVVVSAVPVDLERVLDLSLEGNRVVLQGTGERAPAQLAELHEPLPDALSIVFRQPDLFIHAWRLGAFPPEWSWEDWRWLTLPPVAAVYRRETTWCSLCKGYVLGWVAANEGGGSEWAHPFCAAVSKME